MRALPPSASPPRSLGSPAAPVDPATRTVLEAYAAAKRSAVPPALVVTGQLQGQDGTWEESVGENNKGAELSGHYTVRATLPDQATTGVVRGPGGTQHPTAVLSARDTMDLLTSPRTDCGGCTDLMVTGATLVTMPLGTAFGVVTVPAWRFSLQDTSVAILRVAVPPNALVRVPERPDTAGGVGAESFGVSSDGRTITVQFAGTPDVEGPCGAEYTGTAVESADAVVVRVVEHPHPQPSEPVACVAMAQARSATLTLSTPLGDRVVLDPATGQPVPNRGG